MAASSSGLPQAAPSPPAAASTKGLVRVEHKYTERHVRVCLKAALDQHSVGIMVSSAYALAKEAGFPSMEKAVRLFPFFSSLKCDSPFVSALVLAPSQLKTAIEAMLSSKHSTLSAKRAYADSWVYPTKGGAAAAEALTFFSATENRLLVGICNLATRSGFYVSKLHLKDLMVSILKAEGRECARRDHDDAEQKITDDYMRMWLSKNKVKRYKNQAVQEQAERAAAREELAQHAARRAADRHRADRADMERKVAQLEAEAACMYSAVVQACSRMLIVYCQLIPRRGDAARADSQLCCRSPGQPSEI